MKEFKINDHVTIECEWKKTRTAFKHVAKLFVNGRLTDETKICYLNRTWESYEFQSVLYKVIDKTKALTKEQKEQAHKFIEGYKEEGAFKTLQMVAAIGDILCPTQAEKNTWKKRMMKASLGNAVMFPDDWDSLQEDEKERRLNAGLEVLR